MTIAPGVKHMTSLPLSDFIDHRTAFFNDMPLNSITFFSANSEVTRSNDTEYAFCQNKNFYYLTGFNEPDALLVLIKDEEGKTTTFLFSLPKDALHEVWHGRRVGQQQAVANYGFDYSYVIDEIDNIVPKLLQGKDQALFSFEDDAMVKQVFYWLGKVKATLRQGGKVPSQLVNASPIISELRLIKSPSEIALMRQANYISGLAHQRAMKTCQVGQFEYQIEAEIIHEFSCAGARHTAYASIVAGGDNANILHYTENSDRLKDNELLLIDAGGELGGYAADITRTFPVNGQFSVEQKALYQLVLDAKNLAINAIKPNVSFAELNVLVNIYLTKGLLALGIFTGELERLVADKAVKEYFIHGLGHWLGLDVHDVGDYHINDKREQARPFAVGMVMTIEPGLYIPLTDFSVDKKWRGIGIRIEDNVVVTEQGFENLTANSPDEICDIEALMANNDPV